MAVLAANLGDETLQVYKRKKNRGGGLRLSEEHGAWLGRPGLASNATKTTRFPATVVVKDASGWSLL
jgi:hypothetical protein